MVNTKGREDLEKSRDENMFPSLMAQIVFTAVAESEGEREGERRRDAVPIFDGTSCIYNSS